LTPVVQGVSTHRQSLSPEATGHWKHSSINLFITKVFKEVKDYRLLRRVKK